MIDCNLLSRVRGSFDSLWHCKLSAEDLIEVITPYSFFGDKFVLIYIKYEDGGYVVTDGGLVQDLLNERKAKSSQVYLDIIKDTYDVREFSMGQRAFLYKKTSKEDMLSSYVFDIINAISQFFSLTNLIEERERRERLVDDSTDNFSRSIIKQIKNNFDESSLQFGQPISTIKHVVDFVIYTPKTFKILPGEILSRSQPYHFNAKLLMTKAKLEDISVYSGNNLVQSFVILNRKCQGYQKPSRKFNRDSALEQLKEVATIINEVEWKQGGLQTLEKVYAQAAKF